MNQKADDFRQQLIKMTNKLSDEFAEIMEEAKPKDMAIQNMVFQAWAIRTLAELYVIVENHTDAMLKDAKRTLEEKKCQLEKQRNLPTT